MLSASGGRCARAKGGLGLGLGLGGGGGGPGGERVREGGGALVAQVVPLEACMGRVG